MPRVYGITLPAGIEIIFSKTLKMYDIRVHCNIGKNRRFMSRSMKIRLRDFSKLTAVASAWHDLGEAVQNEWYAAANAQGTNGYSLWTQDKIYRLMNSIAGNASASLFHQFKVGHIELVGAANNCKFEQFFNRPFVLSTTYQVNYKADLVADGPDPYAIFRFESMVYKGGENVIEQEDIELNLSQAWEQKDIIIGPKNGAIANFKLQIILNDVQGDLYFDNVFLEFDGTVQNRDPFCDDVFSNWAKITKPIGTTFESVYPVGSAL